MQNLLYALLGCMVGTLIGVLPGIGPVATIAMLLPITFHLPPTASLIMLAGIYYGAQYGGSTTSILVNLPGEAVSVDLHRRLPDGPQGPRPVPPFRSLRWVPSLPARLARSSSCCSPSH